MLDLMCEEQGTFNLTPPHFLPHTQTAIQNTSRINTTHVHTLLLAYANSQHNLTSCVPACQNTIHIHTELWS